jgi:pyruvate/2-oxoglutarate dehydrogenase complex dihydrolipoamide dehydrogenase (E3) component
MPSIEKFENLVIGSGGAGKFMTWTMAGAGHRTAVVERDALGGACPNVACLPSKNIIYSAKVASLARRGAEFGLKMNSLSIDMKTVQQRKRTMVDHLQQAHADRFKASGAEVMMGTARFVGPRTVEVALKAGGSRTIAADRVFLGVGSRAAIPEVPGLSDAQPMTHVEALNLDRLPRHLIVIGGGYVGLELSQALRRLGSTVTVIQHASQLADREDSDVSSALHDLFVDEGIEVLLDTELRKVEGRSGESVRVQIKDKQGERVIEGSDLLVATGRRANADRMGLELTGVELGEHGYIKVNERLETTAENIWAMGDCAGSPHFTHVAIDDFAIVNANLNGGNRTTKDRLIPFCMFTDPELSRIGRNETEARRDGIPYRLATMPFAEILRTQTVSEPRGFIKMLIGKDNDEIIGFTAFGYEANEMTAAVQATMLARMPFTMLRDAIFAHPTMSEGLNPLLAAAPSMGSKR